MNFINILAVFPISLLKLNTLTLNNLLTYFLVPNVLSIQNISLLIHVNATHGFFSKGGSGEGVLNSASYCNPEEISEQDVLQCKDYTTNTISCHYS